MNKGALIDAVCSPRPNGKDTVTADEYNQAITELQEADISELQEWFDADARDEENAAIEHAARRRGVPSNPARSEKERSDARRND